MCVASILAQQGPFDLQIVITDDESPIAAVDELASLAVDPAIVHVLRQKNAGPGAARNNSLDNLPANTDYVALMDSDDAWAPDFLLHAVTALGKGHDLFFSDTQRFGKDTSRFHWNSAPDLNLNAEQHDLIDPGLSLYAYRGDFFDYAIRRSNILSSSAMVYRRSAAPDLRFDTTLYNGQDRLFKLELCRRIDKVAFTPKVLCVEGEGINIFDSAGWGSDRSVSFAASYIQLSKKILHKLSLSEAQQRIVREHLQASRYSFMASVLHRLRRGKGVDYGTVAKTLREDPMTFLVFIPNAIKAGLGKFRPPRA